MTPDTPYTSTERNAREAVRFILRAVPEAHVELHRPTKLLQARWIPAPLDHAALTWRSGFWIVELRSGDMVGRTFEGLRGADAVTLVRWIASESRFRERLARLSLIRYDTISRALALSRAGGWQPVAARLLISKNEGDRMSGLCLVGAAQAAPGGRKAAPLSPP